MITSPREGREAKYCDQHVRLSVCSHISETTLLRYVLPVLCMTSCCYVIGHAVYGDDYGRGMSVGGRKRREERGFNASAPPLSALSPAD